MPRLTKKEPMLSTIPNKISEKRIIQGWTQKEAADELELTYGTYCSIESGHYLPSGKMLQRFCLHLVCLPEDLYERHILVIIGFDEAGEWIKDGGYWE